MTTIQTNYTLPIQARPAGEPPTTSSPWPKVKNPTVTMGLILQIFKTTYAKINMSLDYPAGAFIYENDLPNTKFAPKTIAELKQNISGKEAGFAYISKNEAGQESHFVIIGQVASRSYGTMFTTMLHEAFHLDLYSKMPFLLIKENGKNISLRLTGNNGKTYPLVFNNTSELNGFNEFLANGQELFIELSVLPRMKEILSPAADNVPDIAPLRNISTAEIEMLKKESINNCQYYFSLMTKEQQRVALELITPASRKALGL